MLNDLSSPLSALRTRRSAKPRNLVAPGPNDSQLRSILEIAMRVPDHGKIAPWRFVIVGADQRDALGQLLERAYRTEKPDAGKLEIEAMHQFARQAPTLVVILSSPVENGRVPTWEQELSAGAAGMNLLHAATAMGFVGGWLTAWPAYNDTVRDSFGKASERIAGFVFIGTPGEPVEERPRPEYDAVVSIWGGPNS